MTDTNQIPVDQWPLKRAMILSAACLAIGLAGGWLIRGFDSHAGPVSASAAAAAPRPAAPADAPDPAQLKQQADAQAAPLLDALRSNPNDADTLVRLGNLYYDAQRYQEAVSCYGRALAMRPSDANVRTDMGTAYWYMGNADSAIAMFNTALTYQPDNPNTLFNRGLVKWQGKHDAAGALADWKRLLASDPNYDAKNKVLQMMAEVGTQTQAQ